MIDVATVGYAFCMHGSIPIRNYQELSDSLKSYQIRKPCVTATYFIRGP